MPFVDYDRCWYCGDAFEPKPKVRHGKVSRKIRTIDHQIPQCMGGVDEPENTVYACLACNNSKGSHDVEGFRRLWERRDNPSGLACQLLERALEEYFEATEFLPVIEKIINTTRDQYPLPVFYGEKPR